MAIFERFRSQAASDREAARNDASQSAARANAAEVAVGASGRRVSYEKARLAELLPDLQEEARLEIELAVSASSLDRARQLRSLARTALELHRKVRAGGGRLEEAERKDAEAASELTQRERRNLEVTRSLAALKAKVAEQDTALRVRFGLE